MVGEYSSEDIRTQVPPSLRGSTRRQLHRGVAEPHRAAQSGSCCVASPEYMGAGVGLLQQIGVHSTRSFAARCAARVVGPSDGRYVNRRGTVYVRQYRRRCVCFAQRDEVLYSRESSRQAHVLCMVSRWESIARGVVGWQACCTNHHVGGLAGKAASANRRRRGPRD